MSLMLIVLIVVVVFAGAYLVYGRFLGRQFGLDDRRQTPAVAMADGMDFVPTRPSIVMAQHFSAIAAAGPIVGPILAGLWFGWLPTLLWIVLGSMFIGAAHDFSTLVASVRHRASSIAEVIKLQISPRAYRCFHLFIFLSLTYVIVAFTDLTVSTFLAEGFGPGVATSSLMYLLLAVVMGVGLSRWRISLGVATLVAVPALVLMIWLGQQLPLSLPAILGLPPAKVWVLIILGYCALASVLPLWLLLQPRGYLGGYFLYGTLAVGLIGLLFGGYTAQYPAFRGFHSPTGAPLVPLLFITVACGACSGFHGLVCSGTTSKQIRKERDTRMVGYGGMLLEGLVALIALTTVMSVAIGDPGLTRSPTEIYAAGLSRFAGVLGVPPTLAMSFGLLAFATFVYDTLDVATRLGRYVLQELTGWQGRAGRAWATVGALAIPAIVLLTTREQAYLKFWPIFGASNQLLAALSLLGISVWLYRTRRPMLIALLPMGFVMTITLWSLGFYVRPWLQGLPAGGPAFDGIGAIALILIGLALLLIAEAVRVVSGLRPASQEAARTGPAER